MRYQHRDDPVLIREFAKRAGIARGTAYLWVRAGEIPGFELRAGRWELGRSHLSEALRAVRDRQRTAA